MKKSIVISSCAIAFCGIIGAFSFGIIESDKTSANTVQYSKINAMENPEYKDNIVEASKFPISTVDDSTPLNPQITNVTVFDENGKLVNLDMTKQPSLFFFYDCGSCQYTLKNWDKKNKYPILVSTRFVPGTKLEDAKKLTHEDLTHLGVPSNVKVYYDLNGVFFGLSGGNYKFPTLVYTDLMSNNLRSLGGLHTNSIWDSILKK